MKPEKIKCVCTWDAKYEGCIKIGLCVIQEHEIEIKKLKTQEGPICPVYKNYNKYGEENIHAFSDLCNHCSNKDCEYTP